MAKLVTPSSTCVNATDAMISTRISPTSIRQPMFLDEDEAEDAHEPVKSKLSTKALEALSTELELEDIEAWLVDFTTAISRVDERAHVLLHASDWRVLTGPDGPSWALEANKRIADAIDAALNPKGANVKLLKSALREAEGGDRPGVLYSGMDILSEIRALVTDRSLGEIRFGKEVTKVAVFTLGATVTDTRLVADSFKRHFQLRPAQERAVPNALLHEIISKMPESTPTLLLKKQSYEDKLYKSEMTGASPPWTVKEIIDYIAVDLARASKAEVSITEKPSTGEKLSPQSICGNCKAKGEHLVRDCPVKCKTCNLNYCPGAWHQACAVTFDTPPSKRGIKNSTDRDLPDFLVGKLDEAWKVKHPGKEVSSLEHTAEASSLEYIYDD